MELLVFCVIMVLIGVHTYDAFKQALKATNREMESFEYAIGCYSLALLQFMAITFATEFVFHNHNLFANFAEVIAVIAVIATMMLVGKKFTEKWQKTMLSKTTVISIFLSVVCTIIF